MSNNINNINNSPKTPEWLDTVELTELANNVPVNHNWYLDSPEHMSLSPEPKSLTPIFNRTLNNNNNNNANLTPIINNNNNNNNNNIINNNNNNNIDNNPIFQPGFVMPIINPVAAFHPDDDGISPARGPRMNTSPLVPLTRTAPATEQRNGNNKRVLPSEIEVTTQQPQPKRVPKKLSFDE